MTNYTDMQAELITRLMVAANSTLFPTARIKSLLQDAYLWATTLFIWRELVRAEETDALINQEYYDYPPNLRTDTIIMLQYLGSSQQNQFYDRKIFKDYQLYKQNNSTSTHQIFASYGRQFFLTPKPTVNLTNGILVWGAIQADGLTDANINTIWTGTLDAAHEAVVKKALSVALKRIDPNLSAAEEKDAIALLASFNKDQADFVQQDQTIQHPMFEVSNYFQGPTGTGVIGQFSLDPDPFRE